MNSSFVLAPEGYELREVDPWGQIYEAKTYGTILKANIVRIRAIEGQGETWEVEFPDLPGISGLIPESQTGLPEGAPMNRMLGAAINVKAIGVDRQEGLVACSRKEAVDVHLTKLLRKLSVGEIIPAIVKSIAGSMVYLDIGGGVMVKLTAEKARVSNGVPMDVQYKLGDRIDLIVKKLNLEDKVIEVDLVNPWEKWVFQRGEILMGTVVTIREKLAFIRVKPGVIGLVPHRSRDNYKIGDQRKFQVNTFDPGTRKLHLVEWNAEKVKQRRKEIAKIKVRNRSDEWQLRSDM